MSGIIPTYTEIAALRNRLFDKNLKHWIHDDLFTPGWWFLLLSCILPWYIWWKLVDKNRIFEILSYGLIWAVLSIASDLVGVELGLWGYPDKLIPIIPPMVPADLTVIPVSYMLVYQYFPLWQSFVKASIVLSALFSYIIEPIFELFDLLILDKWKHTYSFIGFIFGAILFKFVMEKIKKR
ncbi:CBO0543 family protein [Neobacillus niacini]|uniref:CBO0543 family protein n=1 Tax=Neobacillus niacini TaxID=86668 RepID=UPI003B01645D